MWVKKQQLEPNELVQNWESSVQCYILPPCLINFCAECLHKVLQNARTEDAQAGIKIAWRNINNLRHSDDMTLIAESEEELKT